MKTRPALERDDGTYGVLISKETTRAEDDDVTFDDSQNLYIRTVEEYISLLETAGYYVIMTSDKPLVYDPNYAPCNMFVAYPKSSPPTTLVRPPRGFQNL